MKKTLLKRRYINTNNYINNLTYLNKKNVINIYINIIIVLTYLIININEYIHYLNATYLLFY